MVNNQQDLHQVGIDDCLRALRSLGVRKDEISGDPLKIKYKNVAPYSAVQRYSTPVKYEHDKLDEEEDLEKEEVSLPSPKQSSQKAKKRSSLQEGKGFIHKPFGRKPNILYVYLLSLFTNYFISFHFHFIFISFHSTKFTF